MTTLLAGIGWFIGFCGLAVLCNGESIVEAWRQYLLSKAEKP